MAIQIEKPEIKHKYISLFDTEAEFNAAYPNFEEVNWSDVAYPQERPDSYRISRRLSNMYHKNTPPDYKFDDINDFVVEGDITYYADGAYVGTFNEDDYTNGNIRKTFFLEIVWGYSGWEWHDYERVIGTDPETEEPITETLTGGNLYKIKEIKIVPHIIDGYRLYHINDFLNSQDKVTVIEDFDTSHLIAVNRAFKRLDLKHNLNTITPLLLKVYQFPNVEEADDVFFNNKISVVNNNTIEFPLLKNVDGFYQRGEFIDGTTFRLNSLESFTDGFFWTNFSQTDFNVNQILIGDSLKKVNNLSGLLHWAMFYNGREDNDYAKPVNTFTIDLSGSSLSASTEFNLSSIAYELGTDYRPTAATYSTLTDRYFIFNITLRGLTDLSSAFRKIMANNQHYNDTIKGIYYWNYVSRTGPTNLEVNFNTTESLIRNLDYAFAENTFIEQPPKLRNSSGTMINAWANDYTTENYIYQRCRLEDGITYDFSPSLIINLSQGQFNDCYIDPTKTIRFDNVDALKSVRFQNITFGTETVTIDGQQVTRNIGVPFPYNGDLCNFQDYQYNDDPSVLYRFINFSGSMFTELKANQDIYVTGKSAASMFNGCSRIDFNGSNIKLYIGPTYETSEQWNNTAWTTFQGCSSMTKTPKLIASYISRRGLSQGDNLISMFSGCTNLTHIDAAGFLGIVYDFPNTGSPTYIDLRSCPNLVYLDMGDVHGGFNLKGLYNLDISTLSATLLRQTHLGHTTYSNTGLEIQHSVWEALPLSTRNYCEGLPNRRIIIWPDSNN